MKSIYILLTRSNTYVSKMINLATLEPYTHASISFNDSLQPLYSFARRNLKWPLPAGLRLEPFHEGYYAIHNQIPCALYELQVTDEAYEAAKTEVECMMEDALRYRFSVMGLFLCRLNIPLHRKNLYFCSEFISTILQNSNSLDLPKKPSLMRPSDYTRIPHMTLLYQGKLAGLVENRKIYA